MNISINLFFIVYYCRDFYLSYYNDARTLTHIYRILLKVKQIAEKSNDIQCALSLTLKRPSYDIKRWGTGTFVNNIPSCRVFLTVLHLIVSALFEIVISSFVIRKKSLHYFVYLLCIDYNIDSLSVWKRNWPFTWVVKMGLSVISFNQNHAIKYTCPF